MSKVKKIIAIISIVVIVCSIFVLPTSAAGATGTIYSIPMNQPTADEYSGYIECRYRNTSNGNIIPVVYFWRVYPVILEVDPEVSTAFEKKPIVYVTVSDTNGVDINVSIPTYTTDEYQYLNRYYVSYGRILGHSGYIYYGQDYNDDDNTNINVDFYLDPGFEIYGFKLYGNAALDYAYSGYQPESLFTFQYSETSVLYESILAMANSLGSTTQQITDNADKNAQDIQENQDQNTQDIIDNQNQLQQNEKDEAQQSGEGSVDNVSGAIEDKSAGFISSLGDLIQTMSYTGTECAWKFPAIKLPAIEGVMPEYTLTEEKPIDFEFWVNKIPGQILVLIRSLLTIALIVYCFKELYSTISYVLTLKGGGNSE